MARYVERRMKEEEVMKQVVEDIISGHQNAKQAKVRVQEYKRKLGKNARPFFDDF